VLSGAFLNLKWKLKRKKKSSSKKGKRRKKWKSKSFYFNGQNSLTIKLPKSKKQEIQLCLAPGECTEFERL
jgi:hypothetical protein